MSRGKNDSMSETPDNKTKAGGDQPDNKGTQQVEFDPSKLTDEQWGMIYRSEGLYNNPRFNGLREKAKEAETLRAEKKAAEEAKLAEEKKFKELADKYKGEAEGAVNEVKKVKVDSQIIAYAAKKGFKDPNDAISFIDRSLITVAEDGTVTGVDKAIEALATAKSYLLSTNSTTVGSQAGAGGAPAGKIKMSDVRNPVYYQAHEKEIIRAMGRNEIDMDN